MLPWLIASVDVYIGEDSFFSLHLVLSLLLCSVVEDIARITVESSHRRQSTLSGRIDEKVPFKRSASLICPWLQHHKTRGVVTERQRKSTIVWKMVDHDRLAGKKRQSDEM